jgi:predicted nucleic acid-binding protein
VVARARQLRNAGYGVFDSLHLACAETGGASVLLTTDDKFIKRAARTIGRPRVPVRNPLSWSKVDLP